MKKKMHFGVSSGSSFSATKQRTRSSKREPMIHSKKRVILTKRLLMAPRHLVKLSTANNKNQQEASKMEDVKMLAPSNLK